MTPTPAAPITASEMAACVLAILAVLFLALWRRDREPGMAWIGAGFLLAAFWYFCADRYVPYTPYLDSQPARLWAAFIGTAIVSLSIGSAIYLCSPHSVPWHWVLPILAPCVFLLILLPLGLVVSRPLANAMLMSCYLVTALLAFRRARTEQGAGHGLVGAALLCVPATPVLLALTGQPPVYLRHLAVVPTILLGMTLLTVSLLRRRRALEAEVVRRASAEAELERVNQGLEQEVAGRTAELQELVTGLEAFNRSISHDLRGPLGGISGLARMAEAALQGGDASVALRALPAIAEQAETSTRLVAALLALARVSDAEVVRRPVALEALAREVIAELRLARPEIAARFEVGRMPQVDADSDLLRPVLVNLIGNAAKFSADAAHPTVRIDASQRNGEVTVRVEDNGVGFAPEQAAELFQPFRRLHGNRFEGHGVGLSIVRRAIERHGGRVWAEARPGTGATFAFTLPDGTPASAPEPAPSPA